MKQKTTISDLIIKITKMENDIRCQDLQLDQLWGKTIGHYLEEIACYVFVIVILIGLIVGFVWTTRFTCELIKRLFYC